MWNIWWNLGVRPFDLSGKHQNLQGLGSLRPSTEPETPKPRKVSKKSPERSLGPPTPNPRKVPKSPKKVDFDCFLDFSDLFRNFLGVRGSQTPLGRLFWDFPGFWGFGLCRWSERSQFMANFGGNFGKLIGNCVSNFGSFSETSFSRRAERNNNLTCSPGTKTGKRAHSPKPPFCETALFQKTFRYLWLFYSVLFRGFFVVFSWLFRGPLLSRKTVFGPFFVTFSWLFRGPRFGQILRVLALEQSSDFCLLSKSSPEGARMLLVRPGTCLKKGWVGPARHPPLLSESFGRAGLLG